MSLIRTAPHDLAWHKWKLGWLDTSAIYCATSTAEVVLTPISTSPGTKAIVVKIDADTALVAELRRQTGADSRLCDSGLLVYTVEASVASGAGPVQVHSAGTERMPTRFSGADRNTTPRTTFARASSRATAMAEWRSRLFAPAPKRWWFVS